MFGLFKKESGKVINVNDIDELIGKVDLIDIREDYEYKDGSIKSAKNIPMGQLLNEPDKYLNKSKEYYIMCQSGGRSARASERLKELGFTTITDLEGGITNWNSENKPTVK